MFTLCQDALHVRASQQSCVDSSLLCPATRPAYLNNYIGRDINAQNSHFVNIKADHGNLVPASMAPRRRPQSVPGRYVNTGYPQGRNCAPQRIPIDMIQTTTWATVYEMLKAGEVGDPEGMHNMDVLFFLSLEQALDSFDSCFEEKDIGPMGRTKGPYGHTYAWHTWAMESCLVDAVLATSQAAFRPPLNREEIMRRSLVDYVWGKVNWAD